MNAISNDLRDADFFSSSKSDDGDDVQIDPVYSKYNFDTKKANNLPIHGYCDKIIHALDKYPVLVLQGATGCGKTTQVPQFLLDNARTKGVRCNIVVTQPRRIAAISNSERVAFERDWPEKSVVGYQVT